MCAGLFEEGTSKGRDKLFPKYCRMLRCRSLLISVRSVYRCLRTELLEDMGGRARDPWAVVLVSVSGRAIVQHHATYAIAERCRRCVTKRDTFATRSKKVKLLVCYGEYMPKL